MSVAVAPTRRLPLTDASSPYATIKYSFGIPKQRLILTNTVL